MFNFTGTKGRQQLPTDPNGTLPQTGAKASTGGANAQPAQVSSPQVQASGGAVKTNPAIDARIAEIEAQRQAFARKNPDFDMKSEMEHPAFVNYVWGNNLSVEDAYFLVHRQELLEQARTEGMEVLLARKARVPENGTAKNRPAIAKKNPKDLSDKEVDAIIERARNGEKITF